MCFDSVCYYFSKKQPFKPSVSHFNTINITFITSFALLFITWSATRYSFYMAPRYSKPLLAFGGFLLMAPIFYAVGSLLYIMYKHKGLVIRCLIPWIRDKETQLHPILKEISSFRTGLTILVTTTGKTWLIL